MAENLGGATRPFFTGGAPAGCGIDDDEGKASVHDTETVCYHKVLSLLRLDGTGGL